MDWSKSEHEKQLMNKQNTHQTKIWGSLTVGTAATMKIKQQCLDLYAAQQNLKF